MQIKLMLDDTFKEAHFFWAFKQSAQPAFFFKFDDLVTILFKADMLGKICKSFI